MPEPEKAEPKSHPMRASSSAMDLIRSISTQYGVTNVQAVNVLAALWKSSSDDQKIAAFRNAS